MNGRDGPNNGTILPIFTFDPAAPAKSLVGFDPLDTTHVIDDWSRFFPSSLPEAGERATSNLGDGTDLSEGGDGKVRMQFAYKIDPSITDPLADLPEIITPVTDLPVDLRTTIKPPARGPSLALLNLLRGNVYGLHSGQAYAAKLGIAPLDQKYLCIRQSRDTDNGKLFKFDQINTFKNKDGVAIGADFDGDTPLWFYVLAEAQMPVVDYWIEHGSVELTENQLLGLDPTGRPLGVPSTGVAATDAANAKQLLLDTRCCGTQLRGVGGRIVTEVFYGLIDSDSDSVEKSDRKPLNWAPIWGPGKATMARMLAYIDPATAPHPLPS